jgi:hypothetical protein
LDYLEGATERERMRNQLRNGALLSLVLRFAVAVAVEG